MMKILKRVVLKEELLELTGNFQSAIILNQFIYWIEKMYDVDKFIMQERARALDNAETINVEETNGWVYKTAEELNEEIMLGLSIPTVRKYIKQLVDKGFICERRNPKFKWDKTMQYRVDLFKIQKELGKLGYVLEGFALMDGITVVANLEDDQIEKEITDEEASEELERLYKDNAVSMVDRELRFSLGDYRNLSPRGRLEILLKELDKRGM